MSKGKSPMSSGKTVCRHNKDPFDCRFCREESGKAFPPRGYVDRDRWMWINDRCDPGDAARDCPVHFIPHNTHQLPSMVQMMSVEEHSALIEAKDEELARLRAALEKCARANERIMKNGKWGPDFVLSRIDIKTFAEQALAGGK